MYKQVLQGIEDIAIWPMISFVIFFLFFVCLLWWVITADKEYIKRMEELPVEGKCEEQNINNQKTLVP